MNSLEKGLESTYLNYYVVVEVVDRRGRRRKVLRKTLGHGEQNKVRGLGDELANGAVQSSSHYALSFCAKVPDNVKNFPVLALNYAIETRIVGHNIAFVDTEGTA